MKIKWENMKQSGYIRAQVGSVVLRCFGNKIMPSKNIWWTADVSIFEKGGTFRQTQTSRSLAKIKRDAQRIAEEMLLDYYIAIESELRNFTLLE